jgi:hypothetical protein
MEGGGGRLKEGNKGRETKEIKIICICPMYWMQVRERVKI